MRLDPAENQQEVTSHGLAWFIIGCLLALFFGGAVRTLLSPQQLRRWIDDRIVREDPAFTLDYQNVALSLADGFWPRLGINFDGLEISAKDPCTTGARLKMDRLYIPIDPWRLMRGKLHLGRIKADQSYLQVRQAICSQRRMIGDKLDSNTSTAEVITTDKDNVKVQSSVLVNKSNLQPTEITVPPSVINFFRNRWVFELKQTRSWLSGISISSLRIEGPSDSSWGGELRDINLDIAETIELNFTAHFAEALQSLTQLQSVVVAIQASPQELKTQLVTRLQEGVARWQANFQIPDLSFEHQFELQQFPLAQLLQLLVRHGVIQIQHFPKRMWTSCRVDHQGVLGSILSQPMHIRDCRVEGDAGSLQVANLRIRPWEQAFWHEPIEVHVERLKLQAVFEALRREGLPAIFSKPGQWSGQIKLVSPQEWSLAGKLEGLEMVFSNNSQRVLQAINSVDVKLLAGEGRVSGMIENVDIEGGEFSGTVSFNVDNQFRDGLLRLGVPQLSFSPSVQRLMLRGQCTTISLFGEAQIKSTEIVSWKGHMGVQSLVSDGWQAYDLKFKTDFREQIFSVQAQIKKLILNQSTKYLSLVEPIYMQTQPLNDLQWQNLYGDIKITKEGGNWIKWQGMDSDHDMTISSSGHWVRDGHAEGWVAVDLPRVKLLRWHLSQATNGSIELLPEPRTAHEYERRTGHKLKVVGNSESFRNRMINTARKLLPGKTKSD